MSQSADAVLPNTAVSPHTHEVTNQSAPLQDYNLFDSDGPLVDALRREGGAAYEARARAFGAVCGEERVIELGRLANENPPKLRTHDRFGHRIDEVEFHPSYHELMKLGVETGIANLAWLDPGPGGYVGRAALGYMFGQVEAGVGCPLTMTFAAVPALRRQPNVAAEWVPRVLSNEYDPRMIPAAQKRGATIGMAMTEKQGGSDVRANTTRATAIGAGGPGGEYLLTGHKWFCSAPMCDAFLTLAQTEKGLSCFLVPRFRPDGSRNNFFIQRLKDKLGNKSNASSEIEYRDTWCRMVGEDGRGVPTIIEMVVHTRLDCVGGSAALMRQALAQAIHHANHRRAFGKLLIDQPLMRNTLADLALEMEAATALMMRLARAYDEAGSDPREAAFSRLATAVGKYWVCKRCPSMIYESLECLGGAGYVEEGIMPRLFRESPLNSVWEGSGNVICLDVLRAMGREPAAAQAFVAELELARGADRRLDAEMDAIKSELMRGQDLEIRARALVERMALALQASLLARSGPDFVASAFLDSRIGGNWGRAFGTLAPGADFMKIIERSAPKI